MKIAELIQPDINKHLDALYQSFLDLDEHEQIVLKILAVVYKPIGIKKLELLTNCLVDIGLLTDLKRTYHLSAPQREQLTKLSLLIPNREGLQLNTLLANRLTIEVEQLS